MTQDDYIASVCSTDAYRVGGSVRDEILGTTPKDADYVVFGVTLSDLGDALRNTIKKGDVRPLKLRDGRQAGWRVAAKGLGVMEIVLPRTEISTGPGHTDFEIVVEPGLTMEADAVRRDFTINALYRNVVTGEVSDPLGTGVKDIKKGLIKTTHPDSFRDDPLRTLRALRFVSKLGFDLSKSTYAEMRNHAESVTGLTRKGVSGTALDELKKLLMGVEPGRALRLMRDTGVMAVLLPELEPMIGFDQESRYHGKTVDEHTFDAVQCAANVRASLRVRMALLFHDAGKPATAWRGEDGRLHYYAKEHVDPYVFVGGEDGLVYRRYWSEDHEVAGKRIARKIMKRLNTGTVLQREVETLVERHMIPVHGNTKPTKVRRWRCELGDEMLRDLIVMRFCDVVGGKEPTSKAAKDATAALAKLEMIRADAVAAGIPATVKELAIGGDDVMHLEPKQRGVVLRQVLHEVNSRADDIALTRAWQLQRAEALKHYTPVGS